MCVSVYLAPTNGWLGDLIPVKRYWQKLLKTSVLAIKSPQNKAMHHSLVSMREQSCSLWSQHKPSQIYF